MTDPHSSGSRHLDGMVPRSSAKSPSDPPWPTRPVVMDEATIEPDMIIDETKSTPRRRWAWLRHSWRWWVKRTLLVIGAFVILTGGYLGLKTILAARRIIVHNSGKGAPALAGSVSPDQLKGEGDGRINILALGVGGGNHDGPELSDTMMVISIDPVNKTVAMLSIPRDLYVKVPGYGYSKINAANSEGGPKLAEQVVQTVLGIPIQYYVRVDFSGFQQAVNAVGGIDITNTQLLDDPTYPCDNNQGEECGFYLPAGQYHMNATVALKFARCRKGTCGNDFGRAARQQQVLVAIRQRALTLSTLTNPVKIGALIDAVGNHVQTDLQLGDIEKLAAMAKSIDTSKITQKVLDNSTGGLLTDVVSPTAGDILVPKAGTFNYSDIQNLAHNLFADPYIVKENARILVENGSGVSGVASQVVTSLQAAHYNVGPATNATQYYAHTEIIDYSNGHDPYTINYLQQRFGVKATRKTAPPEPSGTTAPAIEVILGGDYHQPGNNGTTGTTS